MKIKQLRRLVLVIIYSAVLLHVQGQSQTEHWRPVYHFTPEKNWTNDPNGLIYIDGVYHLFNQQNPFENKWGHMSWGHATSNDLVHWKHLPIAIPETIDKDTTWRFSGCAVLDKNNTSGFCKTRNCIVAIYTADQPNLKKESQFIAYSNDGGNTFTNYEHNPVIDLQKKDFRDPNVFWFEKTRQWVMTVALPAEHKVRFYSSANLKDWSLLSEFGPQGYINTGWECPFLVHLPVMGKPNLMKWVLMVSAAGGDRGVFMQYFVGDFDGTKFISDHPANTVLTVDYGDCFYAAIPWNNLPGDKKVFIGWMVPGQQQTYPWRGQMSIPRDMKLKQDSKGTRLLQSPSSVIYNSLSVLSGNRTVQLKDISINNLEKKINWQHNTNSNSFWLEAELITDATVTTGFKIARERDKDNNIVHETKIIYDPVKHQLIVDKTNTGGGEINQEQILKTIDLQNEGRSIKLVLLFDKSSLEIFVNDGEKVLTTYIYPDEKSNELAVFAEGGKAIIKSLKIWDLSNMKHD
jgi:fructan beta-fructosidase